MVLPGRFLIKKNFYKVMCRKDEVKMASKDWKLPDAQHKITEEKGLDIENESIQRQWEKTIVSFIRLEDAFSDIDVYDDTEEGEIPYRQYLMRRWLFIHQDKYKNETLKDEDKKKVNELLKTKHIKEDKFMDVIGGFCNNNVGQIDDMAKKLQRRLNKIMGKVPFKGKFVEASEVLTFNSTRSTPTLLTVANCRFFDILLMVDSEGKGFSELLKRIQRPIQAVDSDESHEDLHLQCSIREGMRSLARNKSLKYTSGMIKFSLLQSFPEYYNGEMEKGYVRQALLDLSEMVLYYIDKYPRDELCNRQAYRKIAEYLINTEYKIQKFAEGPKGFRQ